MPTSDAQRGLAGSSSPTKGNVTGQRCFHVAEAGSDVVLNDRNPGRVRIGQLALSVSILVLAAGPTARTERLPIRTYTTADGLAHNIVNRIVKDSRGFLWFCPGFVRRGEERAASGWSNERRGRERKRRSTSPLAPATRTSRSLDARHRRRRRRQQLTRGGRQSARPRRRHRTTTEFGPDGGGESGIRTLRRPLESETYRDSIAAGAIFASVAVPHCTGCTGDFDPFEAAKGSLGQTLCSWPPDCVLTR